MAEYGRPGGGLLSGGRGIGKLFPKRWNLSSDLENKQGANQMKRGEDVEHSGQSGQ